MTVHARTDRRWRLALAAIAVSATAFTAAPFTSALAGEVLQIKMKNLVFEPAQVTAHVGDTIEWVNEDFIGHTATARNKDWDVTVMPGRSGRVTVQRAGKVEYYCRFHPNMTGTIDVE
jgi:plastocyanin